MEVRVFSIHYVRRKRALFFAALASFYTFGLHSPVNATPFPVETLNAQSSCQQLLETGLPHWDIAEATSEQPDKVLENYYSESYQNVSGQTGNRQVGTLSSGEKITWTTIENEDGVQTVQISTSANDRPDKMWQFDEQCIPTQHRQLIYNDQQQATELNVLDVADNSVLVAEPLNPKVPRIYTAFTTYVEDELPRVRVALVDSGVNYTLPQINNRLARDDAGDIIGFDFWDNDALPFDAHFGQSAFHVIRYGTSTASLLLKESPYAELVSYRFPRLDLSRITDLIEHAAANDVKIIGLPFSGNGEEEWAAFADAANAHPDILFIASAGNNGQNIDKHPVYPAALDVDNLLVVTSADNSVKPAERANWGREHVDYMLPAEEQNILNFFGKQAKVSGANYAVPRAMGMAVRWLAANPNWQAKDLLRQFSMLESEQESSRYVRGGYIADPLANGEQVAELVGVQTLPREKPEASDTELNPVQLPLSVFLLHDEWDTEQVNASLLTAEQILQQCNIALTSVTITQLSVPEYLRDFAVGSAKTLTDEIRGDSEFKPIQLFYARNVDIADENDGVSFGRSSSRKREWLQDTIWLTYPLEAPGVTLAHELMHVLSNSGGHSLLATNLMRPENLAENTTVLPEQCEMALAAGRKHSLLFD